MLPRETVVVAIDGELPKTGLAIDLATRWMFQDGRRIGRATAFSALRPGSPDGWLRIETDPSARPY